MKISVVYKKKKCAIGFIEHYGFCCIGAGDAFHVYVSTKLKDFYGFKKWYTIPNMGLIGHNKRVLAATVNALGSTHDAVCSSPHKYSSVF